MKKFLSFFLILTMVLCLNACAPGAPAATEPIPTVEAKMGDGLNVGFAKVDITPSYSVGLGGYSDAETRLSQEVVDRIYATCLAFTEDQQTILVYTVDSISIDRTNAEYFRLWITANTGIPGDNIYFGATHSHSCPAQSGQYKEDLSGWLVQAATEALADRSPAALQAAMPEIPGMNFVRHYEMSDGTYAGSNFGDFSKTIVGHATDSDPRAVLLKFDREEGRRDILMVNWQAHPDSARDIGYNSIAASWVGPLRNELESLSGMHVAYFTGASGNQNQSSRIKSESHGLSWRDYGKKMAQLLNNALPQLADTESSGIKKSRVMSIANINHDWDHMLEQANEVFELWKTVGKAEGDALGKTYGFTSTYQARAIITRANMGAAAQLELNVFSIGAIGFTTGTYEMFSDQGLYVREHSPFDITFIITGNSGYIPSESAYTYRAYEADTGTYAPGTAEKLAEEYVSMLNALKQA